MAGNGKAVGGPGGLEGWGVPSMGRGVGCTVGARGIAMILGAGRERKDTQEAGLEEVHRLYVCMCIRTYVCEGSGRQYVEIQWYCPSDFS